MKGISGMEALKNAEEIMVGNFRIAGRILVFQFPPPTNKKIGLYPRKEAIFLYVCLFV